MAGTALALSRFLLLALSGEAESEFVVGDLDEEFGQIARRAGRRAATRWYVRQVVFSIVPLLRIRSRSQEFSRLIAAALLGTAAPLIVLDRLWTFAYSQIPMKDGLVRAPELLLLNLLALTAASATAGSTIGNGRRAAMAALLATAAATISVLGSASSVPWIYAAAAIAAAPAATLTGFQLARRRR